MSLDQVDTKDNIIHSLPSSRADSEADHNFSEVSIQCPFLQNCDDFVKVSELESHSIKNHKQWLFFDKFFYENLAYGCCFISLLMKTQEPFLIYYFIFDDCWFSVFHFTSIRKKLQYNLTLTRNDMPLFSHTQEVLAFDETVHCPRCMFGQCSLKFHMFSRAHGQPPSRFSYIRNPNVSLEALKLLGNGKFECTVDVLGFDFLVEIDRKYLWKCNNNVIRDALCCIVCTEYMTLIYLCHNGHTICAMCKEKNPECYCKAEFGELRCYLLEEISNKIQLPCRNELNGCLFIGNTARINIHEERCFYKSK